MKEKKNIDRIFQEKFKDFEAEPSSKMWDRISSELDEKEEKKRPLVIPLWMKLGGAAAVLALIIASLVFIQSSPVTDLEGPGVVIEEEKVPNDISGPAGEKLNRTEESISNREASEENIKQNSEASLGGNEKSGDQYSQNDPPQNSKRTIAEVDQNPNSETEKPNKENSEEQIASVNGNKRNNEKEKAVIKPGVDTLKTSGLIAENLSLEQDTIDASKQNQLALVEKKNKKEEENINDKEEAIAETGNSKKLRLSTFAAPVFYTNLGGGNELSSQFAGNPTSSEVTVAYGMKIAYQLSEKLKIRTGISKIDINNNIGGISYSPVAAATSVDNVSSDAANIQIRNDAGGRGMAFESINPNSLSSSIYTPAEISQQFGFIEVPLELEYSLIDSRFSLNLIGGGSSLFLDQNRVDLVSGNSNTSLGEANNINNTSFSTNLGIGLDYQLNDLFSISLEPIFKYQINTFNNVDNVRPANFGIYSGLNFRF